MINFDSAFNTVTQIKKKAPYFLRENPLLHHTIFLILF